MIGMVPETYPFAKFINPYAALARKYFKKWKVNWLSFDQD